jgi:transcriptional regulator with XRE-family HTH domain
VDDQRFGSVLRILRLRAGFTQAALARRAGVSRAAVSSLERGQLGALPLDRVRAVAGALEVRLDVTPRWRGSDLDRLLDAAHAALVDQVVAILRTHGWEVAPETSFSIFGERGSIDVLAWHPARLMLLVVEVKSRIVDIQALLAGIDRKRRLAARVALERGWEPGAGTSMWLAVADTRTNHRRLADHARTIRAVLPGDGRGIGAWLLDPSERGAFLSFLPYAVGRGKRTVPRPVTRLRRAAVSKQ